MNGKTNSATNGSTFDQSYSNILPRKHHKMLGSMAFLLRQIRSRKSDDIVENNGTSHQVSNPGEVYFSTITEAKGLEKVKRVPRADSMLPVDQKFYSEIRPFIVERNCFSQGTNPNFGLPSNISQNNYVRSTSWSHDGKYILTESEDRIARVFYFDSQAVKLNTLKMISNSDLVYEFKWHPSMNVFVVTSKRCPIHCWDLNGHLLSTFRGIDFREELDSAYSVEFSLDGSKIFAGFRNYIRIFDFSYPGQQITELKTCDRKGISNQRGILSTIAACPTSDGVFAVGSFGGKIGLYSTSSNKCECLFCAESSVTLIRYSADGNSIFAGLRGNDLIQRFDLRMPGRVISNFCRPLLTSQRIYFEVDPFDRYLYSGSSYGKVLIFDLKSPNQELTQSHSFRSEKNDIPADWEIPVSQATVAGLSLHPFDSVFAVTTGQRVFPQPLSPSTSDDESSEPEYNDFGDQSKFDNSLQIFSLKTQNICK